MLLKSSFFGGKGPKGRRRKVYRKNKKPEDQKVINPNVLSKGQIELICNILTDAYMERHMSHANGVYEIDIEDLVVNQLGCKIVYENISQAADSIGFTSNGIKPLKVTRDGHVEEVVFEKDTIVLDNCLNLPGNSNRKRFTIGHEAGHVIKSRLYGTNESKFHHAGGVLIETREEMDERFSISEVEANNIAANLLMPESTIKLLMEVLYKSEKLIQYDEFFLDGVDSSKVSVLASIMGVSFTAMFYRLKSLGFIERGVLATYVEENVMREVEP